MEKNIRIKKIVTILLIVLFIITTNVYAVNDKFETTLTVDNTQVKAGQTVTITIGLGHIAIESGEKGIGGYTGRITFDPSILEYVSTAGTSKWDAPFYDGGSITATTKNGEVVNTNQSIGTITFRVKNNAKLGQTTIGLENFSGTSLGADIGTGNKAVTITVVGNNNGSGTGSGSAGTGTGTGTSNNGGSTSNGANGQTTSGNSNTKVNGATTKKENVKSGILPKAGNSNIVVYVAIGGILLAILLYVRYQVINKMIKNKF